MKECPNCGGIHIGQRFDDCPYTQEQGAHWKAGIFQPSGERPETAPLPPEAVSPTKKE